MATSGIGSGLSNLNLTSSVRERAQQLMKEMDTDTDGQVSKQEFAAFGAKMKASGARGTERPDGAPPRGANAPTPPSTDQLFAKADTDGNGSLNLDNLSAMLAEHETRASARGGGHPPGGPGGAGGPPPGGMGGPPPGGGAGGASAGTTSSNQSSSSSNRDPADTDHDGKVSAAEKLAYTLSQQPVSDTASS